MKKLNLILPLLAAAMAILPSCKDDEKGSTTALPTTTNTGTPTNEDEQSATLSVTVAPGAIGTDGQTKNDDYRSISSWANKDSWNLANCHDPSVAYYNGYYYMYGTDASYGNAALSAPHGKHFQGKRSKDLVNWGWVGGPFDIAPSWVLDSINSFRAQMGLDGTVTYNDIKDNGNDAFGYWAPVVRVVDGKLRMYYCIVCDYIHIKTGKNADDNSPCVWAFIGMCESTDPENDVWYDKGFVACSSSDKGRDAWQNIVSGDWGNTYCFYNGIDPTYITTPSGEHWLIYGSWHSGFAALQINPETGKALNPVGVPWADSKSALEAKYGKRIWTRVASGYWSRWQGSEGPEIIYNEKDGYYYMFMAWDGLAEEYNTRVVRSKNPDGPYYTSRDVEVTNGIQGNNVFPIVTHPYKFKDGNGWVGISHCGVFQNVETQDWFYMSQQRLPSTAGGNAPNAVMMGGVRKIFWCPSTADDLNDLWPIASPERFANVPQTAISKDEIAGNYEVIKMGYPSTRFVDSKYTAQQVAQDMELTSDGNVTGAVEGKWSFDPTNNYLTIEFTNPSDYKNQTSVVLVVGRERDWEKKRESTLVFAGFHKQMDFTFWGKKVE